MMSAHIEHQKIRFWHAELGAEQEEEEEEEVHYSILFYLFLPLSIMYESNKQKEETKANA